MNKLSKIMNELVIIMVIVITVLLLFSFKLPDKKSKARDVKKWRIEYRNKQYKSVKRMRKLNRKVKGRKDICYGY